MSFIVTIVHVGVSLFLMLTVLLQAGKGGGMGATFGGGSSQGSVFGGSGAGNFLSKLTTASAAIFMLTSMTLAYLASTTGEDPLRSVSREARSNAAAKNKLDQEAQDLNKDTQPDPGLTDEENIDSLDEALDEATDPSEATDAVEDETGSDENGLDHPEATEAEVAPAVDENNSENASEPAPASKPEPAAAKPIAAPKPEPKPAAAPKPEPKPAAAPKPEPKPAAAAKPEPKPAAAAPTPAAAPATAPTPEN